MNKEKPSTAELVLTYKIKCIKGKYAGQVMTVRLDLDDIEEDGLSMNLIRLGLFTEIAGASSNYFEVLERNISYE